MSEISASNPPQTLPEELPDTFPRPDSLPETLNSPRDAQGNLITPQSPTSLLAGSTELGFSEDGTLVHYDSTNTRTSTLRPETLGRRAAIALINRVKNTLGGLWKDLQSRQVHPTQELPPAQPTTKVEQGQPVSLFDKHLDLALDTLVAAFTKALAAVEAQRRDATQDEIYEYTYSVYFDELYRYVVPMLDAIVRSPNAAHQDFRPGNGKFITPSATQLLLPLEADGLIDINSSKLQLHVETARQAQEIVKALSDKIKAEAQEFYQQLNAAA